MVPITTALKKPFENLKKVMMVPVAAKAICIKWKQWNRIFVPLTKWYFVDLYSHKKAGEAQNN